MYYYKTTIQYEGTNYAGFQWQNDIQTVQSEFNTALSKILDGKFTTMAASRTDTGVHAMDQVVKITTDNPIKLSSFLESFNRILPSQIKCISAEPCDGLFRPSIASLSKEYRYFFTNKTQVSKEDTQFIANIANKLDIASMKICIQALIGTHDFCNFYSSGSNVKSTIREISFCELSEINPQDFFSNLELFQVPKGLHSCYQFKIEANGFLKQMIRHIVSALWMVGSGKLSADNFIILLNGPKSEKQLWKVASPNGLFLYRINYPSQS
ncbi:tRNA pseudouridine(38-40) synthase TruA [Bacteriovorax sp. PP10]|uniref:tRNA pseudouridine synthase A n=1 Tax=Bacteriovorax antarcticus TaxID=3088717 RepID=A0ABU5VQM8_9BACT|nr:tRNA pseudouridine(38-40) synthase TruA [Bacteriovorax sp. PP10]MEA9355342.1 tRNA pseudouridine(38-40) synthase TruA [Bacteriovorax sp. PP10]